LRYVDSVLAGIDGIQIVMVLPETELEKYLRTFHSVPPPDTEVPPFPSPPIPLDDLDRALIGVLIHDARQSWRRIAHRLHVSESTVRARVSRIEASGLLRVIAQIDPVAAGASVQYAWIGVDMRPDSIDGAIDAAFVRAEFSV